MKTKLAWVALVLFAGGGIMTGPTNVGAAVAEHLPERLPPQRFETKVLKVFAAQDGTAIFRAYLVKWKDQEVIASDSLARSDYKEGDTITVLAMNHPFPQGKEPHRLLGFTVMPRP